LTTVQQNKQIETFRLLFIVRRSKHIETIYENSLLSTLDLWGKLHTADTDDRNKCIPLSIILTFHGLQNNYIHNIAIENLTLDNNILQIFQRISQIFLHLIQGIETSNICLDTSLYIKQKSGYFFTNHMILNRKN